MLICLPGNLQVNDLGHHGDLVHDAPRRPPDPGPPCRRAAPTPGTGEDHRRAGRGPWSHHSPAATAPSDTGSRWCPRTRHRTDGAVGQLDPSRGARLSYGVKPLACRVWVTAHGVVGQ